MMSSQDDVEYWANVAAEELGKAMSYMGIGFQGCIGDNHGEVTVAFPSIRDAEALMTLAVNSDETPGSLYDRATSSCVTLSGYARDGVDPSDEELLSVMKAGWTWTIHPAMFGRRMDWHVSLDLPAADANQLTANLHALRLGGV